ncbi:MAG: hypothetical protein RBQ87_03130 [Candidatus Cloacimonadaceae bacterium]|jgi:hypothetical protein|nr:hypothetical protein [Candidatus Cloacimonadota bacterium]MDY0325150.1 hypothetical protein [Candidatus Cloacimonadaceae bacterium]
MKPVSKSVLLTLALVVFSSVAFCQDFPQVIEADSCAQNTFEEGAVDGEKDAMGQGAYLLGGLVFGPLGIMAAAISDPQPDPQKVIMLEQSMGADYVSGYISSFSDVSRKKNLTYAATGFGITVVAVAILVYIVWQDFSNADFWVSDDDYYR